MGFDSSRMPSAIIQKPISFFLDEGFFCKSVGEGRIVLGICPHRRGVPQLPWATGNTHTEPQHHRRQANVGLDTGEGQVTTPGAPPSFYFTTPLHPTRHTPIKQTQNRRIPSYKSSTVVLSQAGIRIPCFCFQL